MVVKEASLLAASGCALGLIIFLASIRVLSSVLFELTPSDPPSLAIGAAVLGGTVLVAGYLPAHRATILDPACTLRQE
jgi:ABC-type antimicrobial peptide transport system permease subunit